MKTGLRVMIYNVVGWADFDGGAGWPVDASVSAHREVRILCRRQPSGQVRSRCRRYA